MLWQGYSIFMPSIKWLYNSDQSIHCKYCARIENRCEYCPL